jgi:hypothetical protein
VLRQVAHMYTVTIVPYGVNVAFSEYIVYREDLIYLSLCRVFQ